MKRLRRLQKLVVWCGYQTAINNSYNGDPSAAVVFDPTETRASLSLSVRCRSRDTKEQSVFAHISALQRNPWALGSHSCVALSSHE